MMSRLELGASMEVLGPVRRDEPLSSRPADVPSSSVDRRDKVIPEDIYEIGSDLDAD